VSPTTRDGAGIPEALVAAGLPALGRDAWVEVDLDAIAVNVRSFRARLPASGHLDVVLKANGYGLGAVEIARACIDAGARALLVATVDEALELRDAGITAPVRVLWRVPPAYLRIAAERAIGVPATSPHVVDEILAADLAGAPPLIVDAEVETGLGRDGILASELGEIVDRLAAAAPRVQLRGIWSHLSNAEEVDRAEGQRRALSAAIDALDASGGAASGVERHLVASGGLYTIGSGEQVARVGIALYGVVPNALRSSSSAADLGLAAVYRLVARPVRVVQLPAGHGVGYGPAFTTERPSRIVTLPIGYADGISYDEKGHAEVLARGVRLPVVGTIAMDSITVDATDHPAADLGYHDDFVFIGASGSDQIEPVDVARRRGTITNEVSTSFAARLARVYTRGGVPVAVLALGSGR